MNDCDFERIDDNATHQTTVKVTTNVTVPSTTKKVKSGWKKMSGHGVITSSNLSYRTCTKI